MSACMSGTRGSGVLSSTGDVLVSSSLSFSLLSISLAMDMPENISDNPSSLYNVYSPSSSKLLNSLSDISIVVLSIIA